MREEIVLRCAIHPLGTLKNYKYVVTLSCVDGRLLLSRHASRATWESQGGHIEPGETPMEAAARELREESGAVDAAIQPLCDYRAGAAGDEANGMVFVAYFEHMEPLTHEIAEVRAFDTLPPPDRLTYPAITPLLYAEALAQKALGLAHVPAADRLRAAALSFWGAVLRQDAAALPGYFAENAVVRWPNTAERFTSAGYIRANCAYPGTWHGTVVRAEPIPGGVVTATAVESGEGEAFHAVSFFTFDDAGRITALEEYWGDDGQPPAWRRALDAALPDEP